MRALHAAPGPCARPGANPAACPPPLPRPVRARTFLEERTARQAGTAEAENQLEALKLISKVVADTGEFDSIKAFKPFDCTTNPSLVLKAVQLPEYQHFLNDALQQDTDKLVIDPKRPYSGVADTLAVMLGMELMKIVPGRVSTECDAHLALDEKATTEKALRIIDMYTSKGIDPKRVYIKIASTWEGIRACENLQKQGIDCNMTLIFSFAQAAACADAGAALISPFVGRIMDWHKKKEGRSFESHEDPGVLSVRRIYKYFKTYNYPTIVMAASFRNVGEIRELAGCDNITIAPALLKELAEAKEPLPRKLWPSMGGCDEEKVDLTASGYELFQKLHNDDQMAVDKLAEGIEGFARDQEKVEKLLADLKV